MANTNPSQSPPLTTKFERLPAGVSNPVDIHVGGRLRLRRTLLGYSQEKIGEAVGLTFQQIQKYERGANRMGASRLYQFSRILDVPVSFFFDDLPEEIKTSEGQVEYGMSDQSQSILEPDPMAKGETLKLVRAYYKITDPNVRKGIFEMVKAVSRTTDNQDDG